MNNSKSQSDPMMNNGIDWFDIISDKRIQSIKSAIYSRLSDELDIEGILTFQNELIQHSLYFLSDQEINDLIDEIKNDRNQNQIEIVRYYWKTKDQGYLLYVLYKDDQNFLVLFLESHISYIQARQKVYKFISYLKEISEAIYRESTKELIKKQEASQTEEANQTFTEEIDLDLESDLIAAIKEKETQDQSEIDKPIPIQDQEIEQGTEKKLNLDTTIPHKKSDFSTNTVVQTDYDSIDNQNEIEIELSENLSSKIHTKIHQPKNISHTISNLEDQNNVSINNYSFNKKRIQNDLPKQEKTGDLPDLDQPIEVNSNAALNWEDEIDPIIWETGKVEGIDTSEPLFEDVPAGNPEFDSAILIPNKQNDERIEKISEKLSKTNNIPKDWLPEKESMLSRNAFISDLLNDEKPSPKEIKLSRPNVKRNPLNIEIQDYRNESGSKINLQYSILLVTRYPQEPITSVLDQLIKEAIRYIALAYNWRIKQIKNYHQAYSIVADVEPQTSPKQFISTISKYTSMHIFENSNNLRKKYLSKSFWAEDYLLENQSDIFTENLIKEFIDLVRNRQGL